MARKQKEQPAPAPESGEIRVEYTPLSELKRAPRNPKLHALDEIGKSMQRFGYVDPLIVDDATGTLVAGHGRMDELELLKATGQEAPARIRVREDGEWLVPVVRGVAFADQKEAEAYLMADNRLVELGGWDDAGVSKILADLAQGAQEGVDPLAGTGYSSQDLARLDAELAPPPDKERVLPVEEKKEIFDAATIKQVVFLYPSDEYAQVLERLHRVMSKHALTDNSQVLLKLLDLFEWHQTQADEAAQSDPEGD